MELMAAFGAVKLFVDERPAAISLRSPSHLKCSAKRRPTDFTDDAPVTGDLFTEN